MTKTSAFSNPHTILLHYSPIDVQNLHGTPITSTQFESRSLLKAFSVAVSNARSKFGVSRLFLFKQKHSKQVCNSISRMTLKRFQNQLLYKVFKLMESHSSLVFSS